jgi:Ca-activated chloride channel family protein
VKAAAAVLLVGLLGGGSLATANALYRAGQVDRAVEEYRRVAAGDSSALARYDMGTALLRLGRYDEARSLLAAAADADSAAGAGRELRFRAAYNAGNTDLEPVFRRQVPDSARDDRLRRAIARYKQALRLVPGDLDAKWNLELAQRLLRPKSGGGGGAQNPNQGGGGGGGNQNSNASPNPQPSGAGGSPISQQQAEKILQQAENSETVVQRQKLKKTPTGQQAVRDW